MLNAFWNPFLTVGEKVYRIVIRNWERYYCDPEKRHRVGAKVVLRDPAERERLGRNARGVVQRNSGATDRVAEEIVQRMERKGVLC